MEINAEYLLGRKQVILDSGNAHKAIFNRKVLITGAAGSIGKELVKQILKLEPGALCLVDRCEHGVYQLKLEFGKHTGIEYLLADITDRIVMASIFKDTRPNIVFHTAAYKHVSLLEDSPYQAIKNNFFGTQVVADLSRRYSVEKFIFISTDKAVNPSSTMGMTKMLSEIYLQSLGSIKSATQFIITRFGNVFGSTGSVYHTFKYQIDDGLPITVSGRDTARYFMTLLEAAQFVLEASVIGNGGDVLVFDMGEPIVILDLAKRMIQQQNVDSGPIVEIKFKPLGKGEKQLEDLWHDGVMMEATLNSQIKIARDPKRVCPDIKEKISYLRKALKTKDPDELRVILRSILNPGRSNQALEQSMGSGLVRNGPVQMNVPTVYMD